MRGFACHFKIKRNKKNVIFLESYHWNCKQQLFGFSLKYFNCVVVVVNDHDPKQLFTTNPKPRAQAQATSSVSLETNVV